MPSYPDLDAIPLADRAPPAGGLRPDDPPTDAAGADFAQVDDGAVLSLAASVGTQPRADTADSLLFAQLAADRVAARAADPTAWVAKFTEVLDVLGWQTEKTGSSSRMLVDPVDWPAILTEEMAGPAATLTRTSLAACDRLPADDKAAAIWAAAIGEGAASLFMVATMAGGDASRMDMTIASFAATPARIGFTDWGLRFDATLRFAAMSLNEDIYAKVRKTVIDKLGTRRRTLIAPVPLSTAGG